MPKPRTPYLLFVSILVAAVLLGACNNTPAPAPSPIALTPLAGAPSRPLGNPILVDQQPALGEELQPDQPIVLTFDQAMDKPSVEKAIYLGTFSTQENKLRVEWAADNVYKLYNDAGWQRATYYDVTLKRDAKSAKGLSLAAPQTFKVNTIGNLAVANTIPPNAAVDVAADGAITVLFNRPVVSLTTLAQQSNLPTPIEFTPAIAGTGEWLNTSIYVFRPTQALQGGTTYVGKVSAGLRDTAGGVLETDYMWTFSVAAPAVKTALPNEAQLDVDLGTPITVTFSQKMNHASTEAAFSIEPATAGTFVWSDETPSNDPTKYEDPVAQSAVGQTPPTKLLGEVLTFVPNALYKRNTIYTIRISEDATAAQGNAPMSSEFALRFSTLATLDIRATAPENGTDKSDSGSGFRIQFTAPVSEATIVPALTFEPAISLTQAYTYYSYYDQSFYINTNLQPSTRYTVTIGKGIVDKYGQMVPPKIIQFTTAPLQPMVYLQTAGNIGTYNANLPTQLYISYRNISKLDFSLAQLSLDEFGAFAGQNGYEMFEKFVPSATQVLRKWSAPGVTNLNENGVYKAQLNENGGALPAGVYLLSVSAPELFQLDPAYKPQRHILVVSPLHITLKRGEKQVLAWVSGLGSGAAQAGLTISFRDKNFKELGTAITSAEPETLGQAMLDVPVPFEPYELVYAVVAQPNDPLFGVAHSDMNNGINPYDFGVYARYANDPYYAYLYTDRPIYRPGQMVFFKGIVRKDDDARYSLPMSLTQVSAVVNNPQGQVVFSGTLPINNGSLSGQFALDNNASTGSYYMQVCLPVEKQAAGAGRKPASVARGVLSGGKTQTECSYASISFLVASYRRPEFEVSVNTDKADYQNGETVVATLDAKYFFGGNVSNAKVQWRLLARDDYFDRYTGSSYYSFGDYGYALPGAGYNELSANGEGVTDAQGKFTLKVPANISQYKGSARANIEVSVTDLNDQSVSARTDAVIHKGTFYFGIAPENYIASVGEVITANVISVDWQGAPVADKAGTITFYARQWFTAQEQDANGRLSYSSVPSDTEVFSSTVTTAQDGKTAIAFAPATGGEYYVVVSSADGVLKSASSVYVSNAGTGGYAAWRVENNDRLELKPDQQNYDVGDVAKVLVPTPYEGGNIALLTVERGNFLLRKTIVLNSNSDVLEIPIEDAFAPNVFVSVLVLSKPGANGVSTFKLGYASLKVNPKAFGLTVSIKPDKTTYAPRDTATYDLNVTDASGAPVQAELSVALVDKAVLSLADANSGALLDSFYGLRGLSVRTADTLSVNVDKLTAQLQKDLGKGGGGGGEASASSQFVRKNFKDTAYWSAVINTDANGNARVSIPLPDNLTTWQLDARAATSDTKVGQATNDVVSTKLLLVRPVTPRFFVVGDEAVIGAVVNNNTDAAIETSVSLQASGVQVLSGNLAQQISVPAKGSARVDWTVKATEAISAEMTFAIQGGGFADSAVPGFAGTGIPILRYASPETVGTAGDVGEQGKKTEWVALPPRLQTGMGELSLNVDSSLAAAGAKGLKAIEAYPYESTDWVACRLMANVANARFIKLTKLGDVDGLQTKLDDLVTRSLQRLYSDQHSDGGWGWWVNDQSNVTLSAMMLATLGQAKEAGYAVDASVVSRATEFLNSQYPISDNPNNSEANRRAFILHALAANGVGDSGRMGALYEKREAMSHYGKALLALALATVDKDDVRVKTLVSDIETAAITSATGTSWTESNRDYENFYASTRSTSIILAALAKLDAKNGLLPNVVRGLMVARKAAAWESVQENAWAVTALADWMIASGETNTNYDWRVTVNDALVLNGKADTSNLDQTYLAQVGVAKLLQGQANEIAFERGAGTGRLYYTARLTAYLPVEDVKAVNRGMVVARKYESADCAPKPSTPCPTISQAKIGENVRVRLTLVAPSNLYFVNVEDPLPAGAEAVDNSLKTAQSLGNTKGSFEFGGAGGWGWWWFSHTELRDDKAVLFATLLPAGTYEYTYFIRPSIAGTFKVMPTHAKQTYFPESFGRGDGSVFVVVK